MSILQMSLAASAMILFAMLLRALALNRLPKRTFVALWLLAAARMLLPWKLPFRYGADAVLRRAAEPAIQTAAPNLSAAVQRTFAPAVAATADTAVIPVWHIVWLAGSICCALALILPHLRWRRVYARALPVEDADIASWLQGQKLLRRVRVRVSDEIPSPLTCGLLRPVILLPARLNCADARRLEYVLAHELTHIRHLDALWKLILAAALCAHWFNPLAWAMYLLANRDIELACDEAVLKRFGDPARRDYARTLIDLAARQSGLPSPLFNSFSRQTIEERIRAIMKTKKRTKIAALAAVLLVAFSALAFATTDASERNGNPEIEELMFDGYENLSVREYRAMLDEAGVDYGTFAENEDLWSVPRYADYMLYVLDPLTSLDPNAEGIWAREAGFGMTNADTDESVQANLLITCTVLDGDHLTVGRLHDAAKATIEEMQDINLLESTQEQLTSRALELEEIWSDGSTIAFQIEIELVGAANPHGDLQTEALLKAYAKLGLEYEYNLGEITMRYRGEEVNGIWDAEKNIIVANSTGPRGLGGGSILAVVYEDDVAVGLRFIEE